MSEWDERGRGVGELWQRLKQRKLVQWAIAYVAFAFALLQGVDIVAQRFAWPDQFERVLILVLVIGFFVVLVLAWYHGEKGAQRVGGAELLIIALLLALGGGAIWYFAHAAATPAKAVVAVQTVSTASAAPAPFDPPADTLAVLPFTNLGGDPKQQYFSDGITEELTNALGQNTALTVIAWDTASNYRDTHESPEAVGKALNVANLLHGSIEHENGQVRVIAELVNTRTGAQVWSSHYDDSLANIFAVQDKISVAIADALKVKFATARAAHTVNPQAYDLVLQATALIERAQTAAAFQQARTLLERAVALDPDYAEAHAQLARVWFDLTQYSTLSLEEASPKALEEANRALALDPDNVSALIALANLDFSEGRSAKARTEYQRAIELDPSSAAAHLDYGNMLPSKQSLAQEMEAAQLDPDNATAQNNLAEAYLDFGEYQQALPHGQALLRLDSHSADNAFLLAQTYALLHRNEDAVNSFDLVQPDTELGKALVAAGKLTYQSVLDPKLHAEAQATVEALRKRPDLDPSSLIDITQLYTTLGESHTALDLLPSFCVGIPAACDDLGVNPMFLPLHGNPAFEALVKKYDTISQPPASAASASPR